MSDVTVPASESVGLLQRPRQLVASTFRMINGLGLKLAGFSHTVRRSFSGGIRWIAWRSLRGLESLFMRHAWSRRGTQNAVGVSAGITGSMPSDGTQTSAGASRNLQEILQIIDDSLEAGISEGVWARITDGLEDVSEATPNSKIPEDTKDCNILQATRHSSELVQLAAKCSKAAYKSNDASDDEQLSEANKDPQLNVVEVVKEASDASLDGMIKACMITTQTSGEDHLLVVAIRGTVSLVDWLVNLDGDLEPTGDFLVFESDGPEMAHRGLLRVAKRMLPEIFSKLKAKCQELVMRDLRNPPELLFTGHSAGGGVAALICAHIRNHCPEINQAFQTIHCITFAAPPVLAPLGAVTRDLGTSKGMTINLVNYGDIVPRADKSYISSLLALYTERAEHPSNDPWDFGVPTTFNYGKIVILQDSSGDEEDGAKVHAYGVSQDLWQTLAFGSARAHPMVVYLEAVNEFVLLHSKQKNISV